MLKKIKYVVIQLEVILLQIKKKKLYCSILAICFIKSCIYSDVVNINYLMPLFSAANLSIQIATTDNCNSNEDICTISMPGNVHTSMLSRQFVSRNTQIQRKSRTLFYLLNELKSLRNSLKFYDSAASETSINSVGVAEVIHFIQDKDGKKHI